MFSTTRIFSFGLGHSPSRSLVKGLARATNGHFVFIPPNSKVDIYVGSQLNRALQPSLVNARLEWHGLSKNGLQAPKKIPPLYIGDRVLVYHLLESDKLQTENISVDLLVDEHKIDSINLHNSIQHKHSIIGQLAAKALIQELQHEKRNKTDEEYVLKAAKIVCFLCSTINSNYSKQLFNFYHRLIILCLFCCLFNRTNSTLEQRIIALSLKHQILSPYTAFVGVETINSKNNYTDSKVRYIPIQISKGNEHLFSRRRSPLQRPLGIKSPLLPGMMYNIRPAKRPGL